ncbi:MAG TPA: sensor histidine kinase N-terminal domain-containing protein [Steroidobacteraceae bacterium]|nr:sensor histidine kinase N-terminal domain-containing protein [Steroidobacteraceae bacterium]
MIRKPKAQAPVSLRAGLLLRLGIVLVLLLALDGVASYFTALHFANLVYDRWLIDSTRSLAQAVRAEHGQIEFDLPRVALEIFQFDEVDKTYFKVSSVGRGFIGGDPALADVTPPEIGGLRLAFTTLHGKRVRLVSTKIAPSPSDPVTVSVAETLIKRSTLTREILIGMAAPQIALLAIALLLARIGVYHGLKPLTDLAAQIEARDQNNLSPVPQSGLPREARVLVARINELLERLSNAMRAQKRFVADAAHQLRTPLAAVLLHTERAERAPDTSSEREALRALHRTVVRAARISQQLLALARTDPEAVAAIILKPLDLTALARSVGEEWVRRALDRDIDFGLSVPDSPVMVLGDERLLSEVLSNLIDNALRYCNPGGHVTVIVEDGVQPRVSVQDDGPGIPVEERTRIFERFYRLSHESSDGCGLGLSIVEEIARLHHATVEVTSGLDDRGARFTVVFQRTDLTASTATPTARSRQHAAS